MHSTDTRAYIQTKHVKSTGGYNAHCKHASSTRCLCGHHEQYTLPVSPIPLNSFNTYRYGIKSILHCCYISIFLLLVSESLVQSGSHTSQRSDSRSIYQGHMGSHACRWLSFVSFPLTVIYGRCTYVFSPTTSRRSYVMWNFLAVTTLSKKFNEHRCQHVKMGMRLIWCHLNLPRPWIKAKVGLPSAFLSQLYCFSIRCLEFKIPYL